MDVPRMEVKISPDSCNIQPFCTTSLLKNKFLKRPKMAE